MKILLVNPASDDDRLCRAIRVIPYTGARAFFAPHAIAAVAALTPRGHEVRLHDEALHGPVTKVIERGDYDVVGVSLARSAALALRVDEIAREHRAQGSRGALVVGGMGTVDAAETLAERFDAVLVGEVETTWPQYLADLGRGRARSIYRAATRPDLTAVPAPRWDLLAADVPRYLAAAVQTSRGCRHGCDFCSVGRTLGTTPRRKTVEQVVAEVAALHRLGARVIYFADDDFCSDRRFALALLARLAELNASLDEPAGFVTQLRLASAADEEVLDLLARANFLEFQLGLESFSQDALQSLGKRANLGLDLAGIVRRVQARGIVALAHLIVGADSDDVGVFARTRGFLDEAGVIIFTCHALRAELGTRTRASIEREGRLAAPGLVDAAARARAEDVLTNIVPKQMSRSDLFEGIAGLYEHEGDLATHWRRLERFVDGATTAPRSAVRRATDSVVSGLALDMMRHFASAVGEEHGDLFFDVLRRARRRAPWVTSRVIYAHTVYLVHRQRALEAAIVARVQAARERATPFAGS